MSTYTLRFESPEAAALSGFPAGSRVAASAADGGDGYVVVDLGGPGGSYLYGVNVHRREDGWEQGSSGNGPGWTLTETVGELGTLVAWGEAPPDADAVRVNWNGDVREAPVASGVYLVAWWRVPCPEAFPRAAAFRVRGDWMPAA